MDESERGTRLLRLFSENAHSSLISATLHHPLPNELKHFHKLTQTITPTFGFLLNVAAAPSHPIITEGTGNYVCFEFAKHLISILVYFSRC